MPTWDPRANELFLKALERRSADERGEYLDGTCAGSVEVRTKRSAATTTPPYQFTRNVPRLVPWTPRYRMKKTPPPNRML